MHVTFGSFLIGTWEMYIAVYLLNLVYLSSDFTLE